MSHEKLVSVNQLNRRSHVTNNHSHLMRQTWQGTYENRKKKSTEQKLKEYFKVISRIPGQFPTIQGGLGVTNKLRNIVQLFHANVGKSEYLFKAQQF